MGEAKNGESKGVIKLEQDERSDKVRRGLR